MNISLILLKDQFYLSPGREGNGDFFFLGGAHIVFRGNEERKEISVIANSVQRGLQSLFIAWEGWEGGHSRRQQSIKGITVFIYRLRGVGQRIFGVIWFLERLKGRSVVANRV